MTDRSGQQFGNYRLIRLLGRGGFADVYLGQHLRLSSQQAAIKILHTHLQDTDIQTFEHEAETISALVHPNIVRLLDFDVENGVPFLTMDYAPNGSLRQRHPRRERVPLAMVVSYVTQIAQGLQYAHDKRIIHRDIKPDNMLIGSGNRILLSDFGVAAIAHSTNSLDVQSAVGTIPYMAPEQIQQHPRPASDQYALGITVYEWLAGELPFQGSIVEIIGKHAMLTPPSLRAKLPALPAEIDMVLQHALAKAPQDRFAAISAFAQALEQAARSAPPVALSTEQTAPTAPAQTRPAVPWTMPEPAPMDQVADPGVTLGTSPLPAVSTPPTPAPSYLYNTPADTGFMPRTSEGQPDSTYPDRPATEYTGNPPAAFPALTPPTLRPARPSVERRTSKFSLPIALLAALLALLVVVGGIIVYPLLTRHRQTGSPQATATAGDGSASGASGSSSGLPTVIKIATDLPVSGGDLSVGKPAENGARLAIDQANGSQFLPGYSFFFEARDDVGATGTHDPATGTQNVSTLVGDPQVAGIIGPLNSSVAQAEMPIANLAPLALISPSNSYPCLTRTDALSGCTGTYNLLSRVRPSGKVTYFRISTTDNYQGNAAADFAYQVHHYRRAFVIDDTEQYGSMLANSFIQQFEHDGGTVLNHDSITSTVDYTQELSKVAALHPDIIYFGGLDSTGGTQIAKQMNTTPGLQQIPFIGGDGIQSSAFASAIGTRTGPVYSTVATVDPTQIPGAASFLDQYYAAYTQQAYGIYSAAAYDCAKILLNAIKAAVLAGAKVPTDAGDNSAAPAFRQAVINQVAKIDYNGALGHQSFDANGDTTNKLISIYQLADVNESRDWKYIRAQAEV
ncbi:MAG TPA: protein kinase [Ktedonobacteraceae bacterium]